MRTLSSAGTFAAKVIFPVFWISGFGLGTAALWLGLGQDQRGSPPKEVMEWIFLGAWSVGTTFILWTCVPLKRVRLDSAHVYVSNYLKEISVPLNMVADVTEDRWLSNHPVTIHFRVPCEFGQSITFMPKFRFLATLGHPHPVVGELKRLANCTPS